jgi:hypothetical protein
MTLGHPSEGATPFVASGVSGDPPWNSWCRTIAHSEDIVLRWYSRRRCFPYSAGSWPSDRIRWRACEVRPKDSWNLPVHEFLQQFVMAQKVPGVVANI